MAGQGYAYRGGYTTYNNGAAPRGGTEGWSKTSYNSDHECQPVLIDANGRRKPMSYGTPNNNTEYYVTKTEVIEGPTYVAEYKQRTPIRVEVVRDYGGVDGKLINRPLSPEKWRKSSSPVRYHAEEKWNKPTSPARYHAEEKWTKHKPTSPVRYHAEEKWTKHKPSSPVRYRAEEKWTKPSSPVRYHAEEKWTKPSSPVWHSRPMSLSPVRYHAEEKWTNRPSIPVHERPHEVENFITKVQTQTSRPNKFGPLSATYWRQPPTVITDTRGGSWTNPSHGGEWSKGKGANLSQSTNDINTAVEYLKEAVQPPSSRYGGYSTIDSREAERRYGGLSGSAPPIGSYSRTIDSREAARKYN